MRRSELVGLAMMAGNILLLVIASIVNRWTAGFAMTSVIVTFCTVAAFAHPNNKEA